MKKLLKKKRAYLVLLLPLAWLIMTIAHRHPLGVEKYFSSSVFSWMSHTIGRFWGLFPFSVAELLIVSAVVAVIVWIGFFIKHLIQKKETRRDTVASFIATLLCLVGCLALSFVFTSGLNYARPGFAALEGFVTEPSSTEDLAHLCLAFVQDTNHYSEQITLGEHSSVHSADNYYALSRKAQQTFATLQEDYPSLSGYIPPTKPVLLSKAMSYAEITGVYFPFTFECNVNIDHPDFAIPHTMMHELAHYKGHMREKEANFIGYLGCMSSQDPFFLYSGSLMGFIYAGNALAKVDPALYWEIRETLSPIAQRDLDYQRAYWERYETPVGTVSTKINDTYLKANRQSEGVKSYGQVVDLLLAYFKEQGRI